MEEATAKKTYPVALGSVYFSKINEIFTQANWLPSIIINGTHVNGVRFTHPECATVFFEVFYLKNEKNTLWVCAIQDSAGEFYDISKIQDMVGNFWEVENWLKSLLRKMGYQQDTGYITGSGGDKNAKKKR